MYSFSGRFYWGLTTVVRLDLPLESNVLNLIVSETISMGSVYSGESVVGSDPSVVYLTIIPGYAVFTTNLPFSIRAPGGASL